MEKSSDSIRSVYSPKQGEGMYHRMKFYDKLMDHNKDLKLKVPTHIYNPVSFIFTNTYKQKSWITVFRYSIN